MFLLVLDHTLLASKHVYNILSEVYYCFKYNKSILFMLYFFKSIQEPGYGWRCTKDNSYIHYSCTGIYQPTRRMDKGCFAIKKKSHPKL